MSKKVTKLLTLAHMKTLPGQTQSQPAKKRKLNDVIDLSDVNTQERTSKPWVTFNGLELTMADKHIISSGDLLSDKHMNFAQGLLRRQHQELTGLQSTLLLATHRNPAIPSPSLQIVHTRVNHWIVATTLGYPHGSPKVCDSLCDSTDQPTSTLLSSLYGSSPKIEKGPKQVGVKDCGVYAIATATLLASGGNPESVTIDQPAMRGHLLKCFENFQLTPFP